MPFRVRSICANPQSSKRARQEPARIRFRFDWPRIQAGCLALGIFDNVVSRLALCPHGLDLLYRVIPNPPRRQLQYRERGAPCALRMIVRRISHRLVMIFHRRLFYRKCGPEKALHANRCRMILLQKMRSSCRNHTLAKKLGGYPVGSHANLPCWTSFHRC